MLIRQSNTGPISQECTHMKTPTLNSGLAGKIALLAAGIIAGGVLATTIGAQAASTTPTSPATGTASSSTSVAAEDAHPGDNGADGVPEAQESHGPGRGPGHGHGHGHGLDLSGTLTEVTATTVTIKTATATATYTVTSTSDIDKNGEATLASLAVGDAVTFSVDATNTKQIDKLHAGEEAKNMPQRPASTSSSSAAA